MYDKAVNYFARLMKEMPDYKNMSSKQLQIQARLAVENMMTIGRDAGTTANARLKAIVNYAENFVPKQTFKKFYSKKVYKLFTSFIGYYCRFRWRWIYA